MTNVASKSRPLLEYVTLAVMLLRGAVYFIARGQRPRMVLMDRGARIKGLRNITFAGPAKLGAHTLLDARYCDHARLGRNFSLGDFSIFRASGSHAFTCPGITVGQDVSFGPYCNVGGGFGLTIGDFCLCGPYVSIHPEFHVTARTDMPIRNQGISGDGITIAADCWLGAKATVLDGATIGAGSIIAAAALVPKGDYPPGCVLGGVPAKGISAR